MDQLFFGIVIVLVLLGLAGYYAWRQVQTLRRLRWETELSEDDRRYTTRLAWRRLLCCGLMVLLAGLMAVRMMPPATTTTVSPLGCG